MSAVTAIGHLWRKSSLFRFFTWSLLCACCIAGVFAITVALFFQQGARIAQTACLSTLLDGKLAQFATPNDPVFRQQAILVAHVHVKRAEEGKGFLCPSGNFWGKFETAKRWFQGTSKFFRSTERHVVVHAIAKEVISGSYELPPQFQCAREYAASNLRIIKKMQVRMWGGYHFVGKIGTMSVYCPK